ncbi:MAG: DUF99 family protein [Candidatus Nanoarchaeia archaeon]
MLKKQIRILGIDDSPHYKGQKAKVLVIGVLFRGGEYLDNLISTFVDLDGLDATDKIIEMVKKSRLAKTLHAVMLDGIALAGFNVIDINKMATELNCPVIVVTRQKPNYAAIKAALKHFKDGFARWKIILKAGDVKEFLVKNKQLANPTKIYFQFSGTTEEVAKAILKLTIKHGTIPEPIRVAHIIGQGIVLGESRGRA